MAKVSKFEPAAQAFQTAHPLHSSVSEKALIGFAKSHANGLAPDLAHVDPRKQVVQIRLHLNQGGASPNLAEDERFRIEVTDRNSGSMIVVPYHEHATTKAEGLLERSLRAAISPITSAQRTLDGVKVDELTPEQRTAVEAAQREAAELAAPVKATFGKAVESKYIARLTAAGVTPAEALKVIGVLAQTGRLQKLLTMTR